MRRHRNRAADPRRHGRRRAVHSPIILALQDLQPSESLGSLMAALLVAVVTLALSLFLAMWAIRLALTLFDRWTPNVNELEELKKGNVAVGVLMGSVVFALASILQAGVVGMTEAVKPFGLTTHYAVGIVVGVLNLVVSLAIGTYAISLALRFLNSFTKEVDEMQEVAKGNVALAVMMGAVVISMAQVVSAGVGGIGRILEPTRVAAALGL
jgi:uncharacterized membrane protein YjfL (UPF0719 family)